MGANLRKYLLISDTVTLNQQQSFIEWLNSVGLGWAHWVYGGWLINAISNQPRVADIRAAFLQVAPLTQVMVFEIEVIGEWGAWLNNATLPHAAQWLRDQWGLEGNYGLPPALPPPSRKR